MNVMGMPKKGRQISSKRSLLKSTSPVSLSPGLLEHRFSFITNQSCVLSATQLVQALLISSTLIATYVRPHGTYSHRLVARTLTVNYHRYCVSYEKGKPAFAWLGARYLNNLKACESMTFIWTPCGPWLKNGCSQHKRWQAGSCYRGFEAESLRPS